MGLPPRHYGLVEARSNLVNSLGSRNSLLLPLIGRWCKGRGSVQVPRPEIMQLFPGSSSHSYGPSGFVSEVNA